MTNSMKRISLVTLALVLPLASCSARRETVVETSSVAIQERAIPAPKTIAISIVGLHDEPAADPSQEKVVGTIVNDGDKRVTGVSIKINALDRGGTVIRTITTPPLAQPIDPNGGRATFEALMPKDDNVAGYHAVAIAL
jgi:hypothetical protein